MAMPSDELETGQGFTRNEEGPTKIDLTEIAARHPVNTQAAVLDLNTFDATQLTLLEVLDMAEAAGVEPDRMGSLLSSKANTSQRMRVMFGLAWVVARRANPFLTFAEVCTWRLEVIGEVDKVKSDRLQKRANVIVNAAAVSGLHPDDAAQLTVAELTAYNERRQNINRAARRARKG